ncbi:MAG TPA: ferrochelatase [Acidobacteriota bacterium]|nr:ferrochelatase [Acidobacteriota bacterium]
MPGTETIPGRGVLLVNLGSPASASTGDVRRYLREFLMDGRVLDIPFPLRALLVNAIIVPFRARKSAEAYRSIWTAEGSPLVVNSRKMRDRLAEQVPMPVALGMRYGRPAITDGLRDLTEQMGSGLREVFLVPLYPHYAMSTVETVVVRTRSALRRIDPAVRLTVLPPFYGDPLYVEALAASAAEHLRSDYDHLLFSYHGLPQRHLRKTDPTGDHCLTSPDCCQVASPAFATCYRAQSLATTRAFVARAGVPEGKYSVAFQSRFGRDVWLEPFADAEIVRLAQEGVRRLLVICPAFTADCLETLEEIGIRGRESFLAAGGHDLRLLPCLNDHPLWIDALARWCTGAPCNTPAPT